MSLSYAHALVDIMLLVFEYNLFVCAVSVSIFCLATVHCRPTTQCRSYVSWGPRQPSKRRPSQRYENKRKTCTFHNTPAFLASQNRLV